MPLRLKVVVPFEHGLSWVVDEWMERASSALVENGRVWLIDPVDAPDAIDQALELGEIAGVLQLLDRHPRDCWALAKRFDVPLHRLPATSPIEGTQLMTVTRSRLWDERALWWPATGTLVVPELVGTNQYYALSGGSVGVHPMMRAFVGKTTGDELPVKHLLVGHGAPVHEHAAEAITSAYQRRLMDLPLLPLRGLRAFRRA